METIFSPRKWGLGIKPLYKYTLLGGLNSSLSTWKTYHSFKKLSLEPCLLIWGPDMCPSHDPGQDFQRQLSVTAETHHGGHTRPLRTWNVACGDEELTSFYSLSVDFYLRGPICPVAAIRNRTDAVKPTPAEKGTRGGPLRPILPSEGAYNTHCRPLGLPQNQLIMSLRSLISNTRKKAAISKILQEK